MQVIRRNRFLLLIVCVLVTGASGGVGSALVQLAKRRGATVIALTTASKAEQILAIGNDEES